MTHEQHIFEEAIIKLKEYTGLSIEKGRERGPNIYPITIGKAPFIAIVRSSISVGNKSSLFSILRSLAETEELPTIVVTGYIPSEIAHEYIANGVNYLDQAGNCNIRYNDLIIQIEGKRKEKIATVNQARAFQETGIKIIFHLLNDMQNLQLTYRDLARLADVSLGSVSNVMEELIGLDFILATNRRRVLKNIPLLLERWVTAYNDILRPRLLLKKMKFTKPEQYYNWDTLAIQRIDDIALWGGEPAASLLTNYLAPEKFTIYTSNSWQGLMQSLKLLPDNDGNIEVLKLFWKVENNYRVKPIVPPLLIYADLMGSRIGRNIETAKMILENELSYIKPAI
jgi:hypothetical protein